MRLLLVEFITGGGLAGAPLPAGLTAEGGMMLAAVLRDMQSLPDVEVTIARDARLPSLAINARVVTVKEDPWACWRMCIDDVEAVLPVAPETDGALERLNTLVCRCQKALLGCAPVAVRITASKRLGAERLADLGVRAVPTVAADRDPPFSTHGWVIKPDDGAGSEQTFFAATESELRARLESLPAAGFVVQPYVPGEPMSLSLLCTRERVRVLACNRQLHESAGATLRQTGVIVNGAAGRRTAMQELAERIFTAVPGLLGYVGVDFIDTAEGPVVLEVNPRLTTAYVGMSTSLGTNAAELMLRACRNDVTVMDTPLGALSVTVHTHA